jgi:hypothetical protein
MAFVFFFVLNKIHSDVFKYYFICIISVGFIEKITNVHSIQYKHNIIFIQNVNITPYECDSI